MFSEGSKARLYWQRNNTQLQQLAARFVTPWFAYLGPISLIDVTHVVTPSSVTDTLHGLQTLHLVDACSQSKKGQSRFLELMNTSRIGQNNQTQQLPWLKRSETSRETSRWDRSCARYYDPSSRPSRLNAFPFSFTEINRRSVQNYANLHMATCYRVQNFFLISGEETRNAPLTKLILWFHGYKRVKRCAKAINNERKLVYSILCGIRFLQPLAKGGAPHPQVTTNGRRNGSRKSWIPTTEGNSRRTAGSLNKEVDR